MSTHNIPFCGKITKENIYVGTLLSAAMKMPSAAIVISTLRVRFWNLRVSFSEC